MKFNITFLDGSETEVVATASALRAFEARHDTALLFAVGSYKSYWADEIAHDSLVQLEGAEPDLDKWLETVQTVRRDARRQGHRRRRRRGDAHPYWARGQGSYTRRLVDAALDSGQSLKDLIELGDSDPGLIEVFLAVVDERRAPRDTPSQAPKPAQPPAPAPPKNVTTQAASFAAGLQAATSRR